MFSKLLLPALAALLPTAFAAFGITTSDSSYVVDAGSSNALVITISRDSCDVTSIKYRGTEVQYQSTYTHINSGLGSANVSATTVSSEYAKITCESLTLTHYIVIKSGDATMYMATHITEQPSVGELRYIARLDNDVYPNSYPFGECSNTKDSSGTIEGSDVFLVDGETRSKFYSSDRFIDDMISCVNGTDNHACFLKPQKETSSGGPFFRDINTNNNGPYTSLTNYMNSGHVQTEDRRVGLNGPYALTFTRSGVPKISDYDFSFLADLDLLGYVSTSDRGYVSGTATGVDDDGVVHWFNADAQYWAYASSGTFTSPAMKPGTYTMRLYKTELQVAETSVTVTAGDTSTKDIANGLTTPDTTIWTIGTCDGQPTGFRNADKQARMHPSDDRMDSWSPGTFTVGTSSDTDMPMAIFASVNSPQYINFTLTTAEASGAATLRIRTTLSFAGGRPSLSVNGWDADPLDAPDKIDSRGVTRGAYRGYGEAYEIEIPDGTLVEGMNSMKLGVTSGSSGDTFLSPNYILDCFELYR